MEFNYLILQMRKLRPREIKWLPKSSSKFTLGSGYVSTLCWERWFHSVTLPQFHEGPVSIGNITLLSGLFADLEVRILVSFPSIWKWIKTFTTAGLAVTPRGGGGGGGDQSPCPCWSAAHLAHLPVSKDLSLISESKVCIGVQGLGWSALAFRSAVLWLMLSSVKHEFWTQSIDWENLSPGLWVRLKPRNIMLYSYGLSFSRIFYLNSVKMRLCGLPTLCQSEWLVVISPHLVCKGLYISSFHFNFHNSLLSIMMIIILYSYKE